VNTACVIKLAAFCTSVWTRVSFAGLTSSLRHSASGAFCTCAMLLYDFLNFVLVLFGQRIW
jgi:hypothetical protein